MDRPSVRRGDAAPRPRRDAFVTIERGVGAPRLFATAYSTVGSSIYFALGVVAAFALGLTPLVFLVAGAPVRHHDAHLLRGHDAASRARRLGGDGAVRVQRAAQLHRRLGDPARLPDPDRDQHAVDRPLPDGVLVEFGDDGLDLAIALLVLVLVARYNFLGKAPRGRRTIALSMVDMALVLMIVGLGLATAFDPPAITDNVQLGTSPRGPTCCSA